MRNVLYWSCVCLASDIHPIPGRCGCDPSTPDSVVIRKAAAPFLHTLLSNISPAQNHFLQLYWLNAPANVFKLGAWLDFSTRTQVDNLISFFFFKEIYIIWWCNGLELSLNDRKKHRKHWGEFIHPTSSHIRCEELPSCLSVCVCVCPSVCCRTV